MKLQITIDEQQAFLMKTAMDLYSRLLMGQIETLEFTFRHMSMLKPEATYNKMLLDEIQSIVHRLKRVVFPQMPLGGSPSIGNPEVNDAARILVDLCDAIEHAMYDPVKHSSIHRASYPPYHHSEVPLAEVKRISEESPLPSVAASSSIDWKYDFEKHDWDHSGSVNPIVIKENVKSLRTLEQGLKKGKVYLATTDTGSPKCGWGKVVELKMAKPWPYDSGNELVPTIVIEKESPATGQLIRESFCFVALSDIRGA